MRKHQKNHNLKIFLSFALALNTIASYGQVNPTPQNLDTLQNWLSKNVTIYDKADSAFEYAHLALRKAKATQELEKIALANKHLYTWHSYNYGTFEQDSAIFYGLQTVKHYENLGAELEVGKMYNELVFEYTANYQHKQAETLLFKAIAIFEKYQDPAGLAESYINLSGIYVDTKDTLKAVEYANKSTELAESLDLLEQLPNLYLGSMHAHLLNKDYAKVFEQSKATIDLLKNQGITDENEVMKAHNRRADAYLATQQFSKALKDYQFAYKGAFKLYGQEHANGYADNIGRVYLKQGQYKAALPYFLAGMEYATSFEVNYLLDRRHHELAECYSNLGDYQLAYHHTTKADSIEKSNLESRLTNLQKELLIKYETEKKDQKISNQTATIAQQNKIQYLSYGILGLLTLLLGGLWWGFRKNQQKNQKLALLNQDLAVKNDQNELLLKEIHHRVKNNLELVKSLLSLQSAQIDNPEIQAAIQASQSRVQSMGIIHQKLYQGKNLAAIEMKDYFINLGDGILDAFAADDRIKIECVMDELELDVDTAVPIGLIVNELLTNALKYAFPKGEEGKIEIQLTENQDNIELKFKDNGIGKVANLSPKGTGFGTQLVSLLTMQLDGTMEERVENGTIVSFKFKKPLAA